MLPVNQILVGDAREVLRAFPDNSINCCISSPPYWALRDYGVAGQLGLEPTFEEYIDKLCTVYDEVFRVLRKDGTCWVNLGDTYGTSSGAGSRAAYKQGTNVGSYYYEGEGRPGVKGYDKSLCLIPERFAIEMVNRGWILRNVIVWHKPNPMPSSAKDRFTVDFEYVFFFVKNNDILWYFRPDGKVSDRPPDYKSGIESLDWQWGIRKKKRVKISLWQGFKYWFEPQYEPQSETSHPRYAAGTIVPPAAKPDSKEANRPGYAGFRESTPIHKLPLGRNKRCVWTIPTQACPEAHFATFPEKLVEPMILAGCPEFVCKKCGKARERIFDVSYESAEGKGNEKYDTDNQSGGLKSGACTPQSMKYGRANKITIPKGYTDCGCNAGWRPGVCLDMFLRDGNGWQGSRTVAA